MFGAAPIGATYLGQTPTEAAAPVYTSVPSAWRTVVVPADIRTAIVPSSRP